MKIDDSLQSRARKVIELFPSELSIIDTAMTLAIALRAVAYGGLQDSTQRFMAEQNYSDEDSIAYSNALEAREEELFAAQVVRLNEVGQELVKDKSNFPLDPYLPLASMSQVLVSYTEDLETMDKRAKAKRSMRDNGSNTDDTESVH